MVGRYVKWTIKKIYERCKPINPRSGIPGLRRIRNSEPEILARGLVFLSVFRFIEVKGRQEINELRWEPVTLLGSFVGYPRVNLGSSFKSTSLQVQVTECLFCRENSFSSPHHSWLSCISFYPGLGDFFLLYFGIRFIWGNQLVTFRTTFHCAILSKFEKLTFKKTPKNYINKRQNPTDWLITKSPTPPVDRSLKFGRLIHYRLIAKVEQVSFRNYTGNGHYGVTFGKDSNEK